MISDLVSFNNLLFAVAVGYLLGSIPVARVVSAIKGIDIFTEGTGLPGAANVFRNVGHKSGLVVFFVDCSKGVMAIMAAVVLELEAPLTLLPGIAAVVGHWKPVFSRFRGGDGYSTLLGVTLALNPAYVVTALTVGLMVYLLLFRYTTSPTFWGTVTFFGLMVSRNLLVNEDAALTAGLGCLAAAVIFHAAWGHHSRGYAFRPWQSGTG